MLQTRKGLSEKKKKSGLIGRSLKKGELIEGWTTGSALETRPLAKHVVEKARENHQNEKSKSLTKRKETQQGGRKANRGKV